MARPTVITDLLVQQAALLACEGKSQEQISDILGVSQPTVSRALKKARLTKILEDRPVCKLSRERVLELKELMYAQGLTARLQARQQPDRRHLREVHIVDIGEQSGRTRAHHERRLRAFAQAASGLFAGRILPKVRKLGVAWGTTLQHLVYETRNAGELPDTRQPIDFLPVCGNPPETHLDALLSASNLVAQLDRFWNGRASNPLNFSGVAASISREFDDEAAQVLRRFFQTISGYRKVFGGGGEPGEIGNVDCILTSVGASRVAEAPWLKAAAEAAGKDERRLADLTYGNLAGVFLPRDTLDQQGKSTVAFVNERWTGIQLEHFLACARSAADGKRVGVVIVASGEKTDVLLECVRLGLVSVLVIDQHQAATLAVQLRAA